MAKINLKSNLIVVGIIILGIASRFIPHPSNFTAIGAIALFGGAYFNNKKIAFLMPLFILFVSDLMFDLFIPESGFYSTMPFVYISFAIITVIGINLRNHKKAVNIFGASLLGSIIFFIISNFGHWLLFYPNTFADLTTCYAAAIPFFHHNILGDLFFNALFFTSAYLVFKKSSIFSTVND